MKKNILNQLTLGVSLRDEANFKNFFTGSNEQLIIELKKTATGSGEQFIYFYGYNGEGCTHLLQASCHAANENNLRSIYLPLNQINDFSPEILLGIEYLDLICIDDIHKIAGYPKWEEAVFHAFNAVRDAGKRLIVSGNVAPKALKIFPDLVSRLSWGIVFALHPLTDSEKIKALILRAECRGLTLSEDVGKFILNHCPRRMITLFAALEALDKISLAAQRKLTIPFVKEVLQI